MNLSSIKRGLAKLAAFGVGLSAAMLLAEGLVLLFVGEQPKFPRRVVAAPWGLRYNDPGATYRHKSRDGTWQFTINHQGMRADRDYHYDKPPGCLRVLVLGDSFAIGYEVDVEQTFARVLERELRRRNVPVEVLNSGVSGYSTAEAALYLERELIKYQPDVVVSSAYENDFADNLRSDLFRLDSTGLVTGRESYVPAGSLGDFLNTTPLFNLLSERSNAFAFAKEQVTLLVKAAMEYAGDEAAKPQDREADLKSRVDYERRLLAAIVERMYAFLHARSIPLVILGVPRRTPDGELVDGFPVELVDLSRPGLQFVSGREVLAPLAATHALYNRFSLNHWTPIAHEATGKALANLELWRKWQ